MCAVDNKSLVSRSRVHIYRVKRATTTNTRSSVIIIFFFFFFFIIPRPRFYQIESQLSKRPLQRPGLPSEEYNKAHDFAFWLEYTFRCMKKKTESSDITKRWGERRRRRRNNVTSFPRRRRRDCCVTFTTITTNNQKKREREKLVFFYFRLPPFLSLSLTLASISFSRALARTSKDYLSTNSIPPPF